MTPGLSSRLGDRGESVEAEGVEEEEKQEGQERIQVWHFYRLQALVHSIPLYFAPKPHCWGKRKATFVRKCVGKVSPYT